MYIPAWLIVGLLLTLFLPYTLAAGVAVLFLAVGAVCILAVLALAAWLYSSFGFLAMCGALEAGFFIAAIAWVYRPTKAGRLARQRNAQRHARQAG
jgi:cbb3-type cytochrome oxidase subunit 3